MSSLKMENISVDILHKKAVRQQKTPSPMPNIIKNSALMHLQGLEPWTP